jgi:hypothetical protein
VRWQSGTWRYSSDFLEVLLRILLGYFLASDIPGLKPNIQYRVNYRPKQAAMHRLASDPLTAISR